MDSSSKAVHQPVLRDEVLEFINVQRGKVYIDATVGDGGHTIEIIKHGGIVIGIDRDQTQLDRASKNIKRAIRAIDSGSLRQIEDRVQLVKGNFKDIVKIAEAFGKLLPQGILFDLGVSSHQLLSAEYGMSFQTDQPLDMRLDNSASESAKTVVNTYSGGELYELFTRLAQEELARPISQAIVRARSLKTITTTGELADIVGKVKKPNKPSKLHPATKVFLALRMHVNKELENLKVGLQSAIDLLDINGKVFVISFQESEDRIVKQIFKQAQTKHQLKIITKKPITPTQSEIKRNPRSRSAKLRIGEKK